MSKLRKITVTPEEMQQMLSEGTIELYLENGEERYRLSEKGYAVVNAEQARKRGEIV